MFKSNKRNYKTSINRAGYKGVLGGALNFLGAQKGLIVNR